MLEVLSRALENFVCSEVFVFLDISRSITALESLCPALEGLVLRLEGFAVGDMACWKFLCAGACVSATTRDRVTGVGNFRV